MLIFNMGASELGFKFLSFKTELVPLKLNPKKEMHKRLLFAKN